MDEKKKRLLYGIAGLWSLLMLSVVGILVLWLPSPKVREITIELGDKLSPDIEDYIDADEKWMKKATMYNKEVDVKKPGTYELYIETGICKFTYQIHVVDTKPPQIKARQTDGMIYVQAGKEYSADYFVESMADLSGKVEKRVVFEEKHQEKIVFSDPGVVTVEIEAEDTSGNISRVQAEVSVEETLTMIGVHDRKVLVGNEFDAMQSVVALDALDGIITDKIKVDCGKLDTNQVGEYDVTYSICDSRGLREKKTVTICVCEEEEWNQWKEYYDYSSGYWLTHAEIGLLCENDYFTYEPLEEGNYKKTMELISPTLVGFSRSELDWAWGCGVIYKITPEYVYFLSVDHVLEDCYQNAGIKFFDGTKIEKQFDYIRLSKYNELSMFRIPVREVPFDTFMHLKQIHINERIYSKLNIGDPVICMASEWDEENAITNTGVIKNVDTMSELEDEYHTNCLQTSVIAVPGMSGTAVVDDKGNLVGVVSSINYFSKSNFNMHVKKAEVLWKRRAELE